MSYILQHTAEEIDQKLDLIDLARPSPTITAGQGADSLIGGNQSIAYSLNAFAYGFGNKAGGRGFKIVAQEEILNKDGTSSGRGN